ncbi:MAG: hypothetical protein BGO82_12830 [Devosia sp. 67-54]|nr:MAG: hypothetical protein BGO82_12830 [Devosia sp. 67-54]
MLQSVPPAAELALIDAEVDASAEAEALASGMLADALAPASGALAEALTPVSGRLAETLAPTSPLADALMLWAMAGADRVQAASSSAASEYLGMGVSSL